ncbi:alpha/beta hydrolase [Paracoccus aestuariivivens]|uniref:Alpha/beta fold hydrolase n=1 Tax=Paracoccus aestuariivivens TaxID=1820333 RepID=A0A6L6JBX4_9RHOB|nr:hypothetical protein [Paracoccus aestuariivivens]MTH79693.1 hypothetical protein [Paracoccus aestuariivivens]
MSNSHPNWTATAQRIEISTRFGALPLVIAARSGDPVGTVLLVHGRNGAPDQAQIAEIAEAYLARGWRVVAPELPYSAALPESGPADRVTFSGHIDAARAAWDWIAREWPHGSRALAGHSLGGYAVAQLGAGADAHHVLAMSPVLSGRALLLAREAMGQGAIDEVRREAPAYFAEMQVADAAPALHRMTAPLAVVTGGADGLIPLKDAHSYFDAAPNARFFAALPDEHHCPAGEACARVLSLALSMLEA